MAIYEFVLMVAPLVLVWYLAIRRGKTPSEPTTWPVLGMLPAVLLNLRRIHDYATEVLTECGGTYMFRGPWLCNIDMLVTCDPANIHHVFSRNFSNYPKGPEFRKIFDILGDGIFGADFELWEIHRKTTLAQLTHADFNAYLQRTVWHKVETGLFPVLDHFCAEGKDLDLQDVFQRLTFDNICKFVVDYDPCSLRPDLPFLPCEKAFSTIAEPLLHRHLVPEWMWRLQKWLNVGDERTLARAALALDDFIYPRVASGSGEDNIDGVNVLKAFEKVYRERNMGASNGSLRDFLKDTSVSLMFAGRDTTSTCLTWLFWLIAQNPASETKILEEMEAELRLKKWRFFSAQETHRLVYLHGALCESLRLFPPVALEHKAPLRPDILPSGHQLQADGKLIISFYSVGRMESVWGKECLEFKPERWISGSGKIKHEPSSKFPAFNAGPRTCLGKEMAFLQMKMVAAAILYGYKVRVVEGHPVSPRDSIILQARDGLKVLLSKRNWI
ncbi:alkane hydroxylase MAH1-like [Salvia miltiorrhiza]|uniref:alkane hydroxylase MAH1-like n=1 Tax=Salvia miltiorrhiza TaxID=226208 RepID=UPI0025AC5755|nr:alkane hydroxylase MAH1-like [Salvia miltiorrhiza]